MITRRRFMQAMGASAAALGLQACSKAGERVSPPAPAIPDADRILVVVDVDGGNDWLNMMPPVDGANRTAYVARRPTLALPPTQLEKLGAGFYLNKDFTGMKALSDAGRVAWIPGIGMNNPNLSHFVSGALWGQGAAVPDGTGWLGRYADRAFDAHGDVLRGLTVTADVPVMLTGASRSFVSIPDGGGYVYPSWLRGGLVGAPYDAAALQGGFAAAVADAPADAASAHGFAAAAEAGGLFYQATRQLGGDGALPERAPAVPYPGDAGYPIRSVRGGGLSGGLSYQLQLVARMIAAGLPARIFYCRLGGWDTHADQLPQHADLQRTLGGALSAFYQDLASIPYGAGATAQDQVLVLAYSEFGRRVQENNGGTDHGTAGLAFVLSNHLTGGVYGDYPALGDLDGNGNMKYTVDFRSLYATVLDGWLAQAPTATDQLLGASYPRLNFL